MITINVQPMEYYDEANNEFFNYPVKYVEFEYSLKAINAWEEVYRIPFLSQKFASSDSRLIHFYTLMAKEENLDAIYITDEVKRILGKYIIDTPTATTFNNQNGSNPRASGKSHTAEEIYAMMFMNGIPLSFEEKNFNKLLVILRVISVYSSPQEKMSKQDIIRQNIDLNEQRKREMNTRG